MQGQLFYRSLKISGLCLTAQRIDELTSTYLINNKCEQTINVETSTIEVGTDIDEMLAGIFSEELELA